VVAALVDQPPGKRANGVPPEAASSQRRGEKEVDIGVLELVLAGLRELCQADDLAFVLDRERGCVVAALCLVEQVSLRNLAHQRATSRSAPITASGSTSAGSSGRRRTRSPSSSVTTAIIGA
jgi:hypothetical protein